MAIPCRIVTVVCPTPTLAFNVVSIDKLNVTIAVTVCNPGEGATWNTGYPSFESEHPDMTKPLNVRVGQYVLTIPDAGTWHIFLRGRNNCGIEAVTSKDVTISLPPANITATSMTATPETCVSPCGVSVSVTWSNTGGLSGTFPPTIKVNTTVQTLPNVIVAPGASVTSTFPVSGLAPGTYTICPVPN